MAPTSSFVEPDDPLRIHRILHSSDRITISPLRQDVSIPRQRASLLRLNGDKEFDEVENPTFSSSHVSYSHVSQPTVKDFLASSAWHDAGMD